MYYVNEKIEKLNRIGSISGREKYLRLDMNENPSGLPEDFIKRVVKKITPEFLSSYPEVDNTAKYIADMLKVSYENICLCNGSDEAIRLIFQTFGKVGSKAVMAAPSFEMYRIYSEMFGLRYTPVQVNDEFKIPVEEIVSKIDNDTSIVVLLNPNNPIGQSYSNDEVEKIIVKAAENGAVVIIDEAYHYFYEKTFIDLIGKYDNLFVLRTFSKIFSIAALRIGFAVGNDKLIKYMKNARSSYNVNSVALLFVNELIQDMDMLNMFIKKEAEGKKYLTDCLRNNGYLVYPQDGNFVFIKPNKNPIKLSEILKNDNILVKTYSYDLLKDYIRVSTGSREIMEKFLKVFLKADCGK